MGEEYALWAHAKSDAAGLYATYSQYNLATPLTSPVVIGKPPANIVIALSSADIVQSSVNKEVPQVRRGTQRGVCGEEKHHVNRPASRADRAAHFRITEVRRSNFFIPALA
ncbi:hypothetical protein Bbelb_210060 [Branchiostoma belcheri]|nr:hypothetical protein Bbelb_210060 [Branchiostoma belcheri]